MTLHRGYERPLRVVRRTLVLFFRDGEIPAVSTRALDWEEASRNGNRRVHRAEYAGPVLDSGGAVYLLDLEIVATGASRYDLVKMVKTYLPEAELVYITE